jgi:hypothetical protein
MKEQLQGEHRYMKGEHFISLLVVMIVVLLSSFCGSYSIVKNFVRVVSF